VRNLFSLPCPLCCSSGTISFGGTDSKYHYNDTWIYDTISRTWAELDCVGFLPSPREGHSAALVDGVVYVYGGRDVGGKDLGDLRMFQISSTSYCLRFNRKDDELNNYRWDFSPLCVFLDQRWHMFQNMGPTPSPRSDHTMATVGHRVFVLGCLEAEFVNPVGPEDPTMVHVLDTSSYSIHHPAPVCPYRCLDLSIVLYSAPSLQNTSGTRI